jgi:hypothetical protein
MTDLYTQRQAEDFLDSKARLRASQTGESYAKAYTAVLDTDAGRLFYEFVEKARAKAEAAHLEAVSEEATAGAVAKARDASADAMVDRARRAFPDMGTPQAMAAFLATPDGEAAYALYDRSGSVSG